MIEPLSFHCFSVFFSHESTAKYTPLTREALVERVAFLEAALYEKDAVISRLRKDLNEKAGVISKKEDVLTEKENVISEQQHNIEKLTADRNYQKFMNEQLLRMIIGAKRARFISADVPEQLKLDFEPTAIEIEEAVAKERKAIRIAYERKRPEHLIPVVYLCPRICRWLKQLLSQREILRTWCMLVRK